MTNKVRGALHRIALTKSAEAEADAEYRRRAGEIAGRAADADALHHAVAWIKADKSLAFVEGELTRLREIRTAVAEANAKNPCIDPNRCVDDWFAEGISADEARERLAAIKITPSSAGARTAASWDETIDAMRAEAAPDARIPAGNNGWDVTMGRLAAELGIKPK